MSNIRFLGNSLCQDIVNRRKWVRSQVNIKEASKQVMVYLFYAPRLCMNYIITMLLLDSCMSTHSHLLYFAALCRVKPKIVIKNIERRTLPGFINISLY